MARLPSPVGVLLRVGLALLVSVLAGVLVAGLAAPAIGGLGLAVKAGTDDFLSLPAELDTPALASRSRVLAVDGSVLATFYSVNRIEVPRGASFRFRRWDRPDREARATPSGSVAAGRGREPLGTFPGRIL